MAKPGLYANINAKKKRIAAGSNEKMRTPGSKGAPTAKDFKDSAKTAKKAGGEISNGGAMMKKKGFAKGGAAKMKRGGAARKK